MEATGPNSEQIEYWNKQAGPQLVANNAAMDALIGPLGLAALERAAPRAGERAIDVGCGAGQTSLQIAERVGPTGSVLGVDISTPLLELAREKARAQGRTNVRFENADAQTHAFPPASVDLVFSRFGVMFFADPDAAFANLARAVRPGGRVAFVCWQPVAQNPWVRDPMAALLKHVPPQAPPQPNAPGPFAFADPARVRGILERAGFAKLATEPFASELVLGRNVDEATAFVTEMGPVGAALAQAPENVRAAVAGSIREVLAARQTPKGVALGCAVWIVTGNR
jgi:SAM-dependent methyltransferase